MKRVVEISGTYFPQRRGFVFFWKWYYYSNIYSGHLIGFNTLGEALDWLGVNKKPNPKVVWP